MYGVMALKSFVRDPNRPVDALFNLGFIDLGGFDATVFNHDATSSIGLGMENTDGNEAISYSVALKKATAELAMNAGPISLRLEVPLPYPGNQNVSHIVTIEEEPFTVNWNGIVAGVAPQKPTPETNAKGVALATRLNRIPAALQGIDIAPPRRGFFKSSYSPVAVSESPETVCACTDGWGSRHSVHPQADARAVHTQSAPASAPVHARKYRETSYPRLPQRHTAAVARIHALPRTAAGETTTPEM